MVLAPFRYLLSFMVFDRDLDLPQHLFVDLADCRAEGVDDIRGVPVEDAQKILMLEVFLRLHAAPGHEGVGDADGGGAAEGRPDVELIIAL